MILRGSSDDSCVLVSCSQVFQRSFLCLRDYLLIIEFQLNYLSISDMVYSVF